MADIVIKGDKNNYVGPENEPTYVRTDVHHYGDPSNNNNTVSTGNQNDKVLFTNQEAVTITTYAGNDTVTIADCANVKVNTGKSSRLSVWEIVSFTSIFAPDDDQVNIDHSSGVKLSTGVGNDSIRLNNVTYSTIDTGSGDDFIEMRNAQNYNSKFTVDGGSGNDTFYSSSKILTRTIKDGVTTIKTLDGSTISLTGVENITDDASSIRFTPQGAVTGPRGAQKK